jgi:hypothetical protein
MKLNAVDSALRRYFVVVRISCLTSVMSRARVAGATSHCPWRGQRELRGQIMRAGCSRDSSTQAMFKILATARMALCCRVTYRCPCLSASSLLRCCPHLASSARLKTGQAAGQYLRIRWGFPPYHGWKSVTTVELPPIIFSKHRNLRIRVVRALPSMRNTPNAGRDL